jgi:thiol:disulfide interchange protein DsbD
VQQEATRFVTIKIDATNETDGLTAIQTRFGVVGLPTIAFVDKEGRSLGDNKEPLFPPVTGFVEAPRFLEYMRRVP